MKTILLELRDLFLLHEKETQCLTKKELNVLTCTLIRIMVLSSEINFKDPHNLIGHISTIVGERDYQIYLKRKKNGQTLEEIGKELGITRERVRQIEANIPRKIKKNILGEGLLTYAEKWAGLLKEKGGIISFFEARRALNENIEYEDFKFICACVSDLGNHQINLFEDEGEQLISFYKQNEIEEAYKSLLSEIPAYVGQTKDELRESLDFDIKYNQAIENFCLDKFFSNKAFIENGKVIGIKGKHLTNVESTFLLAGREMHFEEAEAKYRELFNEKISFRGMLDRAENIVLWGRGTYIHRDLMDVNLEPIEKIYNFISSGLQNRERKTAATAIFDNNKALMNFMKIPTPQALYSILRDNDDHRFLYRKYPDIEHAENADTSRKERDDELNEFFLSAKRPLYKDELVDYFVKKRGMREYQIFFAMERCADIYRMGSSRYVHAKHLGLAKKQVSQILEDVEELLSKENPLILGEAIHRMKLPDLGAYHWSRHLLASIIRKNSNLKVIYHEAVTHENNTAINTIEDLIVHLSKASAVKFTRESLIAHLRLKKFTTNLMTVDKFIKNYGFLLVK